MPDRLEGWLKKNPTQTLTFAYDKDGFRNSPDPRVFSAKMSHPIGSKIGWGAETMTELIDCIVENRP